MIAMAKTHIAMKPLDQWAHAQELELLAEARYNDNVDALCFYGPAAFIAGFGCCLIVVGTWRLLSRTLFGGNN